MNPFVLLFDFRGRVNRAKFWLAAFVYVAFLFAVIGTTMALTSSLAAVLNATLIAYVPLLISSVAVGIKRLHDRNKSAWWLALFSIPVALPFVAALLDDFVTLDSSAIFTVLQYVGFAITIWALVELGCLRGSIGSNQYGFDPLAPAPAPPRTLR